MIPPPCRRGRGGGDRLNRYRDAGLKSVLERMIEILFEGPKSTQKVLLL